MRIRCRYAQYYSEALESILKANKVSYDISGDDVNMQRMLHFSVYEGTAQHESIDKHVKHNCLNPLRFAEYTKGELENARLLTVRPKKQCIEVVNDAEAFEYSCIYLGNDGLERRSHCRQVGVLQIRREPKPSKKNAFYTIDTGFSELFADSRIPELSQKHGIRGMKFAPVKLKNGRDSNSLYQAYSEHIFTMEDMVAGNGEKIITCPRCGKRQFVIDNTYQLSLAIGAERISQDFYMTEQIFGEGQAEPLFIISQKFYRILMENDLLGSLAIAPVQLCP